VSFFDKDILLFCLLVYGGRLLSHQNIPLHPILFFFLFY